MKEFQALGLDISVINDKGEQLQLKQIEEEEEKDDTNSSLDGLEIASVVETEDATVSQEKQEETPVPDDIEINMEGEDVE